MNNNYFPHLEGGADTFEGQKTLDVDYNLLPKGPVALDPRDIIKEWSSSSLGNLTQKELYKGLKIYCPDTFEYKICIWTPATEAGARQFDGNDCVWENIPIGSYDEKEWRDVTNASSFAKDTLQQIVAKKKATMWKYGVSKNSTYWGYFNLNLDPSISISTAPFNSYWNDDKTNDLLNQIVTYKAMKNAYNADVLNICGSWTSLFTMKGSTQYIGYDTSSAPFGDAVGNYLVIVVPSTSRTDGTGRALSIVYKNGGTEYNYDPYTVSPARSTLSLVYRASGGDATDIWDIYIVDNPIQVSAGKLQPVTDNGIIIKFS